MTDAKRMRRSTKPMAVAHVDAMKRVQLRDLKVKQLEEQLSQERERNAIDGEELGRALLRVAQAEDRASIAEATLAEVQARLAVAERELAAARRRATRLEAEAKLARAMRDKENGAFVDEERARLGRECSSMLDAITTLRDALVRTATDLEDLHLREREIAELRERVLTNAPALLAQAAGTARIMPPRMPALHADSLPNLPANGKNGTATMAPHNPSIPIVVDISEVAELIESLKPPQPAPATNKAT